MDMGTFLVAGTVRPFLRVLPARVELEAVTPEEAEELLQRGNVLERRLAMTVLGLNRELDLVRKESGARGCAGR